MRLSKSACRQLADLMEAPAKAKQDKVHDGATRWVNTQMFRHDGGAQQHNNKLSAQSQRGDNQHDLDGTTINVRDKLGAQP